MTEDTALQLTSQMLWAAVQIAAPLLIITMLVGLLVNVLQVVTQIQEVSLSFVPKILSVVVILVVFGPWMLRKLVNYSASVISSIPGTLGP